jgi:hypothetical protein
MSAKPDGAAPSAELRRRILAEVARTPAPTRAEHERRVVVRAVAGVVATTALFVAMGGVAVGQRPTELVAFTAGFGLLAALAVGRLSSNVPGSMLGRPRHVLLLTCVLAPMGLALVALAAGALWPEHAAEGVPGRIHLVCGVETIVQGVLPLAALVLPRRGSDPVHPATTGAALGMAAGGWTAMMAYLRCPYAATTHCILAHVIPTLAFAVVGALLGHLLLKLRT